jgi:hypothetical protein
MAMNRRQRARRVAVPRDSAMRIDDGNLARPFVTLEIDELTLRGIDVSDRRLLAEALERELVLALGARETLETLRSGARERVDGGVISIEANHGAPTIGRQIAQAVRRSLSEPMGGKDGAKISRH